MDTETHYSNELVCLDGLLECLLKERDYLVLYQTQRLNENNARKEWLARNLRELTKERRSLLCDKAFEATPEGQKIKLKRAEVAELCLSNQRFIERSMQRQNSLLENLRKLIGGPPVYSHTGECNPNHREGRVIAARY